MLLLFKCLGLDKCCFKGTTAWNDWRGIEVGFKNRKRSGDSSCEYKHHGQTNSTSRSLEITQSVGCRQITRWKHGTRTAEVPYSPGGTRNCTSKTNSELYYPYPAAQWWIDRSINSLLVSTSAARSLQEHNRWRRWQFSSSNCVDIAVRVWLWTFVVDPLKLMFHSKLICFGELNFT